MLFSSGYTLDILLVQLKALEFKHKQIKNPIKTRSKCNLNFARDRARILPFIEKQLLASKDFHRNPHRTQKATNPSAQRHTPGMEWIQKTINPVAHTALLLICYQPSVKMLMKAAVIIYGNFPIKILFTSASSRSNAAFEHSPFHPTAAITAGLHPGSLTWPPQ